MINSEKNIYIHETETKPNRYAFLVLCFTLIITAFCWLINELGFFRVDPWVMRIGAGITIAVIAIPFCVLLASKNAYSNPKTKYLIISAGTVFTLTTSTLMTFHTTIMLLFPIFLAMLFRSRQIGNIAVISSCVCTAVSPVLGYILGVWDIPLFEELILIGTGGTVTITGADYAVTAVSIGKILLYLVMPKLMMVGSCSLLMYYIIRVGVAHVNNQILLHQVSHRDALTGLYNQNYFKELLTSGETVGHGGVIFFDVNGLKKANDTYGHEYGDLLLQRCAKSISDVCGDGASAFRLGGDEFLLIMENAEQSDVDRKLSLWADAIAAVNRENETEFGGLRCSMATGCAVGDFESLSELVSTADARMYENKVQMQAEEQV